MKLTLLSALALLACLPPAAADEKPVDALRVMAWNIHHGEGEDGKLDLPRLAGVIRQSGADVVLLQEVDDRTKRTGGVPQADELGRLTGMKAVFGKAMDYQGGGYGNAVLTKLPVGKSRVIPLPGGGEPRCALEVTLTPTDRPAVTVVSLHLDVSSAAARTTHAQQLAKEFATRPGLVILGGDFNATPEQPPLAQFTSPWLVPKKTTGSSFTIPSEVPNREIDFILLKPVADAPAPRIADYHVIEEKVASDHRPILMELRAAP